MAGFTNNLLGLSYGNSTQEIIDQTKANYLASLGNPELIYEFLGMARNIGWQKSVEYMNSVNSKPPNAYDWASLQSIKESYNYRIDPPALESTSGFKCKKCGSDFTSSYQKQVRRIDEGATTFVVCLAPGCGFRHRF